MIRAVIFDFDGLIIDTESSILQSMQEAYRAHGHELSFDLWAGNVGRGETFDAVAHLQQLVGDALDKDATRAQARARHLSLIEAAAVRPGVEDRIAEAHALGLKLAVATSSSRKWVEGHLTRRGLLPRFDVIRSYDDPGVGVRKPDPAVYNAALRALGIAAEEAIALEDSSNGVLSATSAGIFTVAIPNDVTRRMGVNGANLMLESLADMTLEEIVRDAEARA